MKGPEYLGAMTGRLQRPSYIQVASYGYIVKPVARAIKTKHAGFNLVTWATSYKLDRLQAIGYYRIRK